MTNMPAMELLDNPHAPDVFADSATGFFLLNGNIRITFERGGPGCLNRFSASISGASARVRLPSGGAAA
jgi:hypothetical protein